jgi:hypothetical protein
MAASSAPSSIAVTVSPRWGERHSRLPGATADLDHPVSCLEPSPVNQIVEQFGRTDRPGALVVLCCHVKTGTQAVAPRVIRHESHRWNGCTTE